MAKGVGKGQISIEFILTISLLILIFIANLWMNYHLRNQATDVNNRLSLEIECSTIADLVEAVYASGPETQTVFVSTYPARVIPGLVELNTTETSHICAINPESVNASYDLPVGSHTIKNEGGRIEFA